MLFSILLLLWSSSMDGPRPVDNIEEGKYYILLTVACFTVWYICYSHYCHYSWAAPWVAPGMFTILTRAKTIYYWQLFVLLCGIYYWQLLVFIVWYICYFHYCHYSGGAQWVAPVMFTIPMRSKAIYIIYSCLCYCVCIHVIPAVVGTLEQLIRWLQAFNNIEESQYYILLTVICVIVWYTCYSYYCCYYGAALSVAPGMFTL